MTFAPQDQPWTYFTGRHGNLHDIPRKDCEWYDEEKKRWAKCFEMSSIGLNEGRLFLPDQKYRIKKTEIPK